MKVPQNQIMWGYELEAHLAKFQPFQKLVKINICNEDLLQEINKENFGLDAHVEYGAWMIELIPSQTIK